MADHKSAAQAKSQEQSRAGAKKDSPNDGSLIEEALERGGEEGLDTRPVSGENAKEGD